MNFMKGLNLSHDWIFGGFYGSFAGGYYEICYDCQNQDLQNFRIFRIRETIGLTHCICVLTETNASEPRFTNLQDYRLCRIASYLQNSPTVLNLVKEN